jgi:hypothetical protein
MHLLGGNSPAPIIIAGLLTFGVWILHPSPFDHDYHDALLFAAIVALDGELIDSVYRGRDV